ncbi:MAG: hypothetical protein PF484_01220 [Bacteroidales bacterium]|nr:hypothetical protein [Bacteroidales bacterium]
MNNIVATILQIILIATIALLVALLPLSNSNVLINGIQTDKSFSFFYSILALVAISAIAILFRKNKLHINITIIDILLLAYVSWVSINKYLVHDVYCFSLKYYELLGLSVLYIIIRLINIKYYLLFLVAICISGTIQAIYGCLQLWGYYPSHHGLFKMTGSFFNPEPYAGFMRAVLPVAVGLYWKLNHKEHGEIKKIKHEGPEEYEENHEGRKKSIRYSVLGSRYVDVKPETILRSSVLSVLVFGLFAYSTEILPIKMVATLCIALLAGTTVPLLKGEENSFVKKPSCPLCPSWLKLNLWLKLPLTLATVFAIVLLLPQVNKLHQAYITWNDAYQLYNYNLYAECLEEYEKALPVLQHNADFMLNYGIALSMVEKHPEALEILKKAKAYQSNSVLHTALGDSHKALEEYESAEKHYLQAANMAPAKFYPLYLQAKLYNASGQQQKAFEMANTILEKEVKVHSTAIDEIKEEMKQIIEQ